MTLADFTRESLCLPRMPGNDPATVLAELSRALERAGVVRTSLALLSTALNQRFLRRAEAPGSRHLACSVARLAGVTSPCFAVALTPCGAGDACAVFLLAAPERDAGTDSFVMAALEGLAADPAALPRLTSARTPAAMLAALGSVAVAGEAAAWRDAGALTVARA